MSQTTHPKEVEYCQIAILKHVNNEATKKIIQQQNLSQQTSNKIHIDTQTNTLTISQQNQLHTNDKKQTRNQLIIGTYIFTSAYKYIYIKQNKQKTKIKINIIYRHKNNYAINKNCNPKTHHHSK